MVALVVYFAIANDGRDGRFQRRQGRTCERAETGRIRNVVNEDSPLVLQDLVHLLLGSLRRLSSVAMILGIVAHRIFVAAIVGGIAHEMGYRALVQRRNSSMVQQLHVAFVEFDLRFWRPEMRGRMMQQQVVVVVIPLHGRQNQSAVTASQVEKDIARLEVQQVERFLLSGHVGGVVRGETILILVGVAAGTLFQERYSGEGEVGLARVGTAVMKILHGTLILVGHDPISPLLFCGVGEGRDLRFTLDPDLVHLLRFPCRCS